LAILGWFLNGLIPILTQAASPALESAEPTMVPARVVARHPHDAAAYTQGLFFQGGDLYESTGRYGRSSIRRVRLATGETLQEIRLADHLFGEGIAPMGDRIIQLTWRAGRGFVYGAQDLSLVREFRYQGEGWGVTSDGRHLIVSDGTAGLSWRDPESFAELRRVQVHTPAGPVSGLNELEFVDGEIYANVWPTDWLVRIEPDSGRVLGWMGLHALRRLSGMDAGPEVANGIAYDAQGGHLYVTGKLWPFLFEIERETGP
jgi:glutamine cyclotransferase